MKLIVTENQYKFLVNEACGDDTEAVSKYDFVKPSKLPGVGNSYPVFSCVKLEPMTIMGDKIYPKNHPKDVVYKWEKTGEENGKKWMKRIQIAFNKWKDPSTSNEFHPWIRVRTKVSMEGKKTEYGEINEITNSFKCGANFCIDIKFNSNTSKYKRTPNSVDDRFRNGGKLVHCSDCNDVIVFPNFGSYDSLKKFAADISKIQINLNKLT